ncbi:MAG: hypothetical protein J0J06_02900 [Sphingomonas sp.]|uniref:hypothetical protein n=1 Tax=Sphingomonas sp. TaxID=28214 RepID=UPI001ACAFE70|nr:hypothetical protein [Sphingomonas sp.]MBN8814378.1 hypothetical protein [Sphingomonas sp.]
MSAHLPRAREKECALRPDLAAYYALRRVHPDRLDRVDAPTLGVLAELARHGRPW